MAEDEKQPVDPDSREAYDDEKRRRRKEREPFEYIRRVHQLQREK